MSQKENSEAFVLRAIPYSERDLIVTLLTKKWGRLSAVAKNARSSKRFAGGVQLFRKVDAIFQLRKESSMHLFLEMNVLSDYAHIESSYDKIMMGSYGTELLRELSRDGEDSAPLFHLLQGFYTELHEFGEDLHTLETILHHFELRLLEIFGAIPSLWCCQRCGLEHTSMERIQCTRTGEGLLCTECRRTGEAIGLIERDTLTLLQHFDRPFQETPKAMDQAAARKQARRVLHSSFNLILQRELKSRTMLDSVLL